MPKLNQIVAIIKGTKEKAHQDKTIAHHKVLNEKNVSGLSRTYRSLSEDGERFPDEGNIVQARVESTLDDIAKSMSKLYDLSATRDVANCIAKADVTVDGEVVVKDSPTTLLMYLEKELNDWHTLVQGLPVLPSDAEWDFDANQNCYKSRPVETSKTKKISRAFVKYEATKEHPAQVDVVGEDILQGYWTTIRYSGALTAKRKAELIERAVKLLDAVKVAREQANLQEATNLNISQKFFGYLLAR